MQGTIRSRPAILIAERAAFSTAPAHLSSFVGSLTNIKNLGANDVYSWFLASSASAASSAATTQDEHRSTRDSEPLPQVPSLKLNLIYPSTPKHVLKYSQQGLRTVTETPLVYRRHVQPYMSSQRSLGRLNWVFNILDGRTEQEDVLYREAGAEAGFLLLPDLNWDRSTLTSLHLLGIVERRDLWSVRDLRREHVDWLRHVRGRLVEAVVRMWEGIERDQLKLYVHCMSVSSVTFDPSFLRSG